MTLKHDNDVNSSRSAVSRMKYLETSEAEPQTTSKLLK
ncbi:hypothetical protein D088_430027 [Salmonella enterica subsp. houtenae serovar 16:z4,z32:-- str. RKS3027]|nr:hypothetical protein D088_430027 [Salmonella enterica subsp. houtenae serovar 16:z4,z32:-- str. RKS3027]